MQLLRLRVFVSFMLLIVGDAARHGASRKLRGLDLGSDTFVKSTGSYGAVSSLTAALAASAEPSPNNAHALLGRRALGDTLSDAAAGFMSSLTAGADAAASEAGREAGKEAKGVADALMQHISGDGAAQTSATSTAAPIPMPVPAPRPAQALLPAPETVPAPTPAGTPQDVLYAPSISPSTDGPAGSEAQLNNQKALSDKEMTDVANFQLGAFLLEHASLIDPLEGGTYGHVIQAVKLAQQQLHVEAIRWLKQQEPQPSSMGETVVDAVSKLPQNFADLPKDVAETVADAERHIGSEALNSTYYMDQWEGLIQKLKGPVAIQAGAQMFANNLCFFSTNFGALEVSATGISVAPSLVSLSAAGINVAPQAMSISPALVSVGATGVNVSPTGLNIAPALIAVTPGRVAINPQGGTISPVGLSVTAPSTP